MAAIAFNESNEELLCAGADIRIIETQSGDPAGSATFRYAIAERATIASNITSISVLAEGPLGGARDQFGNDNLYIVVCRQVHHSVIVAPIVLSWRNFDCRPHEPVAECVHSDACRSLMVPGPILFGRVRFAEVNSAVRKHGRFQVTIAIRRIDRVGFS